MNRRRTNPLWLLLGLPLLALRRVNGKLLLLGLALLVAFIFWPREDSQPVTQAGSPAGLQEATISRVVDGDTFDVSYGGAVQRVRIIGVDTPETVHPRKPVQCFGREASAKTKALLAEAGNRVYLEKDVSETDRYSRLLRYAWIDLAGKRLLLNEVLVSEGYAQVSTYPPDVKYQDRFLAAQRAAREGQRGLWYACRYFGEPAPSSQLDHIEG